MSWLKFFLLTRRCAPWLCQPTRREFGKYLGRLRVVVIT